MESRHNEELSQLPVSSGDEQTGEKTDESNSNGDREACDGRETETTGGDGVDGEQDVDREDRGDAAALSSGAGEEIRKISRAKKRKVCLDFVGIGGQCYATGTHFRAPKKLVTIILLH